MPDRNVSNQKHEETTTRSSGSALAGSACCTWKGWGNHVPKPHKKIKQRAVQNKAVGFLGTYVLQIIHQWH